MGLDAGTVGTAFAEAWEHLIAGIPAGWCRRARGAIVGVTQVGIPTLNGVWVHDADARAEEVSMLLDRVADEGVPYCLQLTPRCDDSLRQLAHARRLQRETEIPLMALRDDSGLPPPAPADGELTLRVLQPQDATLHADVAAAGFHAPAEVFRRLVTSSVLGRPGVCTYLGEVDGEPVATGVGVQLDQHVGIFNVATLSTHRCRGYGAAITARAVRDGFAHGARSAWLQSSTEGYGIYRRLGFSTLEAWECWVSA